MKKITLFILLAIGCVNVNAQKTYSPCDNILIEDFDEIEGTTFLHTKPVVVINFQDSTAFRIGYGIPNKNSMYFIVNLKGIHMCVPSDNRIHVLFTDNTRLELINQMVRNCKGENAINIDGILSQFKSKKIKAIRIYTIDGPIEVYLSNLESNELSYMLICLCNSVNR